jgi:hypothetical protein
VTSAPLRELVPAVMLLESGSSLGLTLRSGSPSCPFDGFTLLTASPLRSVTTRSGAGFSDLLSIAYDYDVLGLGPDSPWVDWRCPGTLRLSVWMVLTSISLLIPAFALVLAPPVLSVWLLCCTQRSPTISRTCLLSHSRSWVSRLDKIHSFGRML